MALLTSPLKVLTQAFIPDTPNAIVSSRLNLADRGWLQTCAFSVLNYNTIQWGAGSLIAADGTTYSISAGNVGSIGTTRIYIYLDIAVSITVYQTTTTITNAVGVGKILVATTKVVAGTAEPEFMVFGSGVGGVNLNGTNIVAGSVTANEILANTITANELAANSVTAGKINAGAIDSMVITGATVRTSATNPRVEMDSTGLKAYNSSGTVWLQVPTGTLDFYGGGMLNSDKGGDMTFGGREGKPASVKITTGAETTGGVHVNAMIDILHDTSTIAFTTDTAQRVSIDSTGLVVTSGSIGLSMPSGAVVKINSNQIIGARGAAVADATDAASVITQLNALLARLRTHGLIAT
jgi:hypothetical protein